MPDEANSASDSVAATLYQEIEALGGFAANDHEVGINSAVRDVLELLKKRGHSPSVDPLIDMTLNRDNLREYLADRTDERDEARDRADAAHRKVERTLRMLRAVVDEAVRLPAEVNDALKVAPAKRTAYQAAELAVWHQSCLANAVRFVAELATMTDNECDSLDGYGKREVARMLQVPDEDGERAPTVPRLYSDEDRMRAVDALNRRQDAPVYVEEIVDVVAEALGMRRAGA